MGRIILVGAVLFISFALVFIFLLPDIVEEFRMARIARNDYKRARGTQHARQLATAIRRHEEALRPDLERHGRISSELSSLDGQQQQELADAAIRHVVDAHFTDIPGVGNKLKDRVMQVCFDGTLESLLRAPLVRGIGQEKATAIRAWVHQTKQDLPRFMRGDFPRKAEIVESYRDRQKALSAELKELEGAISRREEVISAAVEGLEKLNRVTASEFKKALKGDPAAAEAVRNHVIGAFAEWEEMPSWFLAVMKNPPGGPA